MSWECPEYPKKNSPGAQANDMKKCGTSGACAQINELLNVRNIRNKYANCNTCPWSVRNIRKKKQWHIYFGYFGHSAAHLFVHMLWKFHIFSGHLPEHQDCFLSGIPDTLRKCITFGIIISDISDIQQFIYLCTCSESSTFFQDIYLSTRAVFFRIFRTLPGRVLQLAYLFRILQTFSSSFICAPSPDALEVLHFFRTFVQALGMFFFGYSGHSQDIFILDISFSSSFICAHPAGAPEVPHFFSGHLPELQVCFFWIFRTLPGHVLHLTCLFQIFQTFSTSFICAHSLEGPHFCRRYAQAQGLLFSRYSEHSQDMCYI